jgi:FAD synthase
MVKKKIKKKNWKNNQSTALMLGRYQPWHKGHKILFKKIIKKNKQVLIMVKDVYKVGDNPFSFLQIKKMISKSLINYKGKYKIILSPNITEICYGRKVGYKIKKINISKKIQKISATKIRKLLRKKGKLKI